MAFLPPFGMINPLPTVNHNDFQDWMRPTRPKPVKKHPILIGYAAASPVHRGLQLLIAAVAAGAIGLQLVGTVKQITREDYDVDYMISEIMEFLRRQRMDGKKPGKGVAIPLPFWEPTNRPRAVPKATTKPEAIRDIMVDYFKERERDDPERRFLTWFERRWKHSPVIFTAFKAQKGKTYDGRRKKR